MLINYAEFFTENISLPFNLQEYEMLGYTQTSLKINIKFCQHMKLFPCL